MPTDEMKSRVKAVVRKGTGRVVMGGDDKASELALTPIKELLDYNIKENEDES